MRSKRFDVIGNLVKFWNFESILPNLKRRGTRGFSGQDTQGVTSS